MTLGVAEIHISLVIRFWTPINITQSHISYISNLPIDNLNGIPNATLIRAIERNWPAEENEISFHPIKSYNIEEKNINFSILKYQRKALREKHRKTYWLDYKGFKESRDSIAFYDLNDNRTVHKVHLDTLKVAKGNVIIRQRADHDIIEIIIEEVILSKDGSNSLEETNTYFLKPTYATKSDKFSDYGIFKEKEPYVQK